MKPGRSLFTTSPAKQPGFQRTAHAVLGPDLDVHRSSTSTPFRTRTWSDLPRLGRPCRLRCEKYPSLMGVESSSLRKLTQTCRSLPITSTLGQFPSQSKLTAIGLETENTSTVNGGLEEVWSEPTPSFTL